MQFFTVIEVQPETEQCVLVSMENGEFLMEIQTIG